MAIFAASKQVSIPFDCPNCGSSVDLGNDFEYCGHVEFIWIWNEKDFWAYVRQSFAQEYIVNLKKKYGLRDEEGDKIAEEIIESFIAVTFEPADNVSAGVPFYEQIIEELAYIGGLKLYEESRTYSGAVVGIKDPTRK
jgi:hypothetical protein